jgi:hypothetical protein
VTLQFNQLKRLQAENNKSQTLPTISISSTQFFAEYFPKQLGKLNGVIQHRELASRRVPLTER